MQVTENRGVSGIFMNRLIRKIRIISYITRGIREPVRVLIPPRAVDERFDNTVDNVMKISAECDSPSGNRR